MTLQEIEERMDELSRRLVGTHDKKIIKELYDLALELEKLERVIGLKIVVASTFSNHKVEFNRRLVILGK
jgi:hypothetical protein